MKWIAVKHPAKAKIEIVRIKDIKGFVCDLATGDRLKAQSKTQDVACWEIASLPDGSPAAKLLAQLNGPVGEVPYK